MTADPHIIRLRGPWRCLSSVTPGAVTEFTPPGLWSAAADAAVTLLRPFNWVAPLSGDQQVWLVVGPGADLAEVYLNDQLLGRIVDRNTQQRFALTALLQMHNRLRLEIPPAADRSCWLGAVHLEIDDDSVRDLD